MAEGEGGKAAGLKALQAFANVPAFVVVPEAIVEDAAAVTSFVASSGVEPPFAVRSSAEGEDGEHAAFAGMFQTKLRVQSSELPEAVTEVAASLSSDRLAAYLDAKGSQIPKPKRIHVVVQSMVDARVAGVCATRLPEARGDDATVEAVLGLGETLVSGVVEPDRYRVEREGRKVFVEQVGNQAIRLSLADGEELVPAPLRQAQKLSAEEAATVAALGFEVEQRLGWAGADVEWAFEEGRLWALQARPIASLGAD